MPATKQQIRQIIADNNLNSVADVYSLLKDSFKDILQELMEAELDASLGYEKNQKGDTPTSNKRNGHSPKTFKSQYGEFQIDVPRNRNGEFEPKLIPKYQRDISGIEEKVISLYARSDNHEKTFIFEFPGNVYANLYSIRLQQCRQSGRILLSTRTGREFICFPDRKPRRVRRVSPRRINDEQYTDYKWRGGDDENGSMTLPVNGGTVLSENYVGAAFADYDSYLVLSHFKGHAMAGFGGAGKSVSDYLGNGERIVYINVMNRH